MRTEYCDSLQPLAGTRPPPVLLPDAQHAEPCMFGVSTIVEVIECGVGPCRRQVVASEDAAGPCHAPAAVRQAAVLRGRCLLSVCDDIGGLL